ncbi:MAG: chemotaxis protein CheW [Chromatiales bacterium]|jgi:twitching motility protein PilI
MSSPESRELLALLRDIESRSRQNAVGLPRHEEVRQLWEGVVFSVSGVRLVSALGELVEILNHPPRVTAVPGALPWVLGIANIRGSLLPIIDLQHFLGGRPTVAGRRTRVLVIRHEGTPAGLLVGEVFGMRHFFEEDRGDPPHLDGRLGRYVRSAFEQELENWPVFSIQALTGDPDFQVAAA